MTRSWIVLLALTALGSCAGIDALDKPGDPCATPEEKKGVHVFNPQKTGLTCGPRISY
ncbi:MAG: hypothetical protein KDJ15_05135 [Alphaproteobacteria bacterium]|nr:hypothetical protein [Alphaproteobacteria bacterium]